MSDFDPSHHKTGTLEKTVEISGSEEKSRNDLPGGQAVTISDPDRNRILKLIDQGKSLDPGDLLSFYQWMDCSYDVLAFHPLEQERFGKYCRSLLISNSVRISNGLEILKSALGRS